MGKIILPASLIGVGLGFVVLSVVLGFVVVPNIIDNKIEEEVSLIEGTDTWDKWEKNPVPIYFKFYIFNVTNPDEVNDHNAVPILQETGPYTFREERVKTVSDIDEDKDIITYTQSITYFFEEEMSIGSLDDRVNIVNIPLMAIATNLYGKLGPAGRPLVNGFINIAGERIVKKNVKIGEMTFDGYEIPPGYGQLLGVIGEIPPEFANDSFGLYKGKNGSHDGVYRAFAGRQNTANFGKIITWEGLSRLEFWRSPDGFSTENDKYCNAINGTDGGIFAPFIEKDTIIRIFVTEICRSIHLEFLEEEEHQGINGYKFGLPDGFFEDPKLNGDNYCFCPSPPSGLGQLNKDCSEGVIRLFSCQNDAPLVTSSPHFHRAAPEWQTKVEGMKPIPGDHDTQALLEPNSGMLLKISKRLQINVEMQNFSGGFEIPMFDELDHYLFPVFWADESAALDEENADDLKGKLLTPMKIVGITKWIVIGLGALLVAAGIAVIIKRM